MCESATFGLTKLFFVSFWISVRVFVGLAMSKVGSGLLSVVLDLTGSVFCAG